MRVGVDVRFLRVRRGVGNYLSQLLRQFEKVEADFEFYLYGDSPEIAAYIPKSPRFQFRVLRPSFYPLWEQVALPVAAWRDRIDVLHCPGNTGPIFCTARVVVGIMDVIYMLPTGTIPKSPSLFQRLQRLYYRAVVPVVAARAQQVITISNYSKADIIQYLHLSADRVRVCALAGSFGEESGVKNSVDSRAIPEAPFILVLGAVDPRKNTARAIEAFAKLSRMSGADYILVVAGLRDVDSTPYRDLTRALGIESKVNFVGFVSDETLRFLYSHCAMFLYLSLYEGFGLPVLDAMSCGAPVVASHSSSIPEVAGDAAILVAPEYTDAAVSAMIAIHTDKALALRLSNRGKERATHFSWRSFAEETVAVYKMVGTAPRGR